MFQLKSLRRSAMCGAGLLMLISGSALATVVEIPFDAANFNNNPRDPIDNPYLSQPQGATFAYSAYTDDECDFDKITVLPSPYTVAAGVKTWAIRDTGWVTERADGECLFETAEVTEDTKDFEAQDVNGNVWYMGEQSYADEDGACSTEGSWEAGVAPAAGADPATPGILMLADPSKGQRYRQEFAEDVAEDWAAVTGIDGTVSTLLDNYSQCLKTKEWSPLEPGQVEYKTYCLASESGNGGTGLILIDEHGGKTLQWEFIGPDLPANLPGDGGKFPAVEVCQ